jgi:phosphoribosylaminoimidazole-succinocarboxamide synthase
MARRAPRAMRGRGFTRVVTACKYCYFKELFESILMSILHTSSLHSLPLLARGKVRDNYAVGSDQILMLASDRISAFDVIMGEGIPGKGQLLTQMALFWFDKLQHIVPNHLTGLAPESVVAEDERDLVQGRAMLVKRLQPIPVEAVVRGYLAGSGWQAYQATQSVCGEALPAGLRNSSPLPKPIFTPARKAEQGEHDENISFAQMSELIGPSLAKKIKAVSLNLYQAASVYAQSCGLIIADTKFEFGLDEHGKLVLMDEILTPDSSRYWLASEHAAALASGVNPPSFDKQFLRDWLLTRKEWNQTAPAPQLPADIVQGTAKKYDEAAARLGVKLST